MILNLINAFYAVNEKKNNQQVKHSNRTVSVCTKKIDKIGDLCKDNNGNGIPGKIKEKSFNHFYYQANGLREQAWA